MGPHLACDSTETAPAVLYLGHSHMWAEESVGRRFKVSGSGAEPLLLFGRGLFQERNLNPAVGLAASGGGVGCYGLG